LFNPFRVAANGTKLVSQGAPLRGDPGLGCPTPSGLFLVALIRILAAIPKRTKHDFDGFQRNLLTAVLANVCKSPAFKILVLNQQSVRFATRPH
jgi:hypothetical protein